MKIPLSRPDITNLEKKAVLAVLATDQLSRGPKIEEFEKQFARFIGVKYAVAVNSGTSGLHLCIKALDIGAGDEVITTPFSFVASANSILFERAKPVFCDIAEDTLNIDTTKIEEKITKKTKAILVVHVFGYPSNMAEIMRIAKKHQLAVIEDACEAIGASIGSRNVGSFGNCGVFAFYPNKQMTTGEGGMIVTNNKKIASLAASLRNQGRDGDEWLSYQRMGYNYRLSELSAALGLAQLARLKEMSKKRAKVAKMYSKELSSLPDIVIPKENAEPFRRSWFVYVIRLGDSYPLKAREELMAHLKQNEIGCEFYFPPIYRQPFYQKMGYKSEDYPVTDRISRRTIALPFFNNLKSEEVKFIVKKIKEKIAGFKLKN